MRTGTTTRVALGFCATMFIMLAYTTASTVNVAIIFSRLPHEFFAVYNLIKSLTAIAFFLVASPIVDRFSRVNTLYTFLAAMTAGIIGAIYLMDINPQLAVSILSVCEGAILMGFSVFFWASFTETFTTLEGKRYFPIVASAYGVGGVLGGLLIGRFVSVFSTQELLVLWAFLNIACGSAVFGLHRSLKRVDSAVKTKRNEKTTAKNLSPSLKRFASAIFLYIFAIWVIRRMVEYRFNITASHIATGEDGLSVFLGYYYAAVNTAVVIYQLAFNQAVMNYYGLTRLIATFPIALVVSSLVLLISGADWAVIGFRGLTDFFFGTIALGTINLLYTTVPSNAKGKMQTFVEAVGKFAAGAVASMLVYLLAQGDPTQPHTFLTDSIILLFSIACTFAALFTGRQFIQTAIDNIQREDSNLIYNSIQALQERGNALAIRQLLAVANSESFSDPFRKTAIRVLSSLRHERMIDIFFRKFDSHDNEWTLFALTMLRQYFVPDMMNNTLLRHKVANHMERLILSSEGHDYNSAFVHSSATALYFEIMRRDRLPPFLEKALSSDDPRLIANSIEGIRGLKNRYAYLYISRFVDHYNNRVRSTAIVELWNHYEDKTGMITSLESMLKSPEKRDHISAIWAIGRIKDVELFDLIKRYRRNFNLEDDDYSLHLAYTMLRFPLAFLTKTKGFKQEYLEDLYRIIAAIGCDTQSGHARRVPHYIKRLHPSHFRGLTNKLYEATQEGVDFLFQNILNETDLPIRLRLLVQRFTSNSVEEGEQRLVG